MSSRLLGVATRVRSRVPMMCFSILISAMPGFVLAAPAEISLAEAVQRAVERAPLLDARRAGRLDPLEHVRHAHDLDVNARTE